MEAATIAIMFFTTTLTPIGSLTLVADRTAVIELQFETHRGETRSRSADWIEDAGHALLQDAAAQLGEYFAGVRTQFDLPLRPAGTEFQQRVWAELRRIPFGETISYGELARRIGNPNASRAVGLANGRNPIAIVIPCHRVIGADGSLTGFGGGVNVKRKLLQLEGVRTPSREPALYAAGM